MNRLTDERLEAIRTYLVSGYSNLRERALCECIAQLLAEVERTRYFESENEKLWDDLEQLGDCSICGGT